MNRLWECWYCIHIALLTPAQLTCKLQGPVLQRTATCTPWTTQTPFHSFHHSTLDCLLGSSSSAEKTKVLKQYAELTALGNKMLGYVMPFQNLRVVLITQQAHTSEKSLQDFTNPKFHIQYSPEWQQESSNPAKSRKETDSNWKGPYPELHVW